MIKTARLLRKRFKRFLWNHRGVLVATPSVAGLVILLRLTGFLQPWEWNVFDLYMRWRPQETRDPRIAIVGIDEKDLHQINESIISDRVLADLLKKIKAQQPRVIGLDIYRDLPVVPGHDELVEVFQTTPNLVGIQKVAGEAGIETVAPPPVLKEKGQVGANDLIFDGDNRVRRGLIYLNDGRETVYSFSLHLALRYLEKEGITPQVSEQTSEQWQLGKTIFKPLEANDGGYVRTDAGGYQLLINYRGGNRHFETVSMTQIMKNQVPPDWGRDRIILVGKVGESFKDLFFIPYSTTTTLMEVSKPMTGVEIHANLTSQIISTALEGRPLIRTWSEPVEWIWIIFWSGIGASLSWQLRYLDGIKIISWRKWLSFISLGGVLFAITFAAFLQGWWLPTVPVFLAFAGSTIAITSYVARTAIGVRKTFGRYLTDQVVASLLESPTGLKLGGERRKITLLTSDLRGFTVFAEHLPSEEVIKIINFYLGYMADVITKYEGTIDEFMGDGILVLFGAPTSKADDAQRAIACALEMQMAIQAVNQQMIKWGLLKLEMGIGIHTGEVIVGNIGSEKRAKYGVVGAQVNLTYRIESYTTGGQILISEATFKEIEELVVINEKKQVQPKGILQPITIYSVVGIADKYNLFLPKDEEIFYSLEEPILVEYRVLEGKDINVDSFHGNLIELSNKGALIAHLEHNKCDIKTMTNIKGNLLLDENYEFYAKVRENTLNNQGFNIIFTAKSPLASKFLDSLYEPLKLQSTKIDL